MNTPNDDRQNPALEGLKIASPCNEPWEGMSGDDRKRFCDRCELQVYNLSGMTRDEATDLVRGADDRLCVRFHRRSDGTVLTQDCPVGLAARTSRLIKACAAALLGLIGFLPGCRAGEPSASPESGTNPAVTTTGDEVEGDDCEMGEIIECEGDGEILQGDIKIDTVEPLMGSMVFKEPEMGKMIVPPAEEK